MLCALVTIVLFSGWLFFFFKQKTAYEMRISDWSSDVCSSDLQGLGPRLCAADARVGIGPVAGERDAGQDGRIYSEGSAAKGARTRAAISGAGAAPRTAARGACLGQIGRAHV